MNLRYRNFKVYQESRLLHLEVVKVTRNFGKEFDYLTNQIRRSSLSVVLNIAEGSSKRSDKDFNRYLETAMGSVNETVAGLEIAGNLNLLSRKDSQLLEDRYAQVVNQLGGFSKKLKSS